MVRKQTEKKPNSRKLAVLTGGGDAQGMNAALRAVSRVGLSKGWQVYGIRDGFYGLYRLTRSKRPIINRAKRPVSVRKRRRGVVDEMDWEYMSWAIRDGGSSLGTIRYEPLGHDRALQKAVVKKLTDDRQGPRTKECGLGVEALVVIGGNGSIKGAHALANVARDLMKQKKLARPLSVVAVPASIDNDIPETEISIGVDSALNLIVDSIDKLVDTTSAVNRAIVVETMGRECGYLAVFGALASGAEEVFCPEVGITQEAIGSLLDNLNREYAAGRRTAVIVVGEQSSARKVSAAQHIANCIAVETQRLATLDGQKMPWDVRKSVLGHLQRGGPTSAFDRILATRMGAHAVELLEPSNAVKVPRMVKLREGEIRSVPLKRVAQKIKKHQTAISRDVLLEHAGLVRKLSSLPAQRKSGDRVVILTGGTDAQGMNMVLRAASQYGVNQHGLQTWGCLNGFEGLIHNKLMELAWNKVGRSRIRYRRAGSVLGVRRRPDPFEPKEKEKILTNLRSQDRKARRLQGRLRGLIVIGGLGTALRANELREYFAEKKFKIPIVYVPANIDHGLPATHATVGFDAALNVVVASCDRITDTTQAMDRVSIVDTMGGGVGALTLMGALAAGAECAIVAEDYDKSSDPLVEATGSLRTLQKDLSDFERKFATVLLQHRQFQQLDIARLHGRADMLFPEQEVRTTELGHTQRGGNPSYYDRLLGTIMGVEAVKTIMNQRKLKRPTGKLLRQKGAKVEAVDLKWALSNRDGENPWSDATRMENAKPLWRYEEIAELFNKISIYARPKKPLNPKAKKKANTKTNDKTKKKTKKK